MPEISSLSSFQNSEIWQPKTIVQEAKELLNSQKQKYEIHTELWNLARNNLAFNNQTNFRVEKIVDLSKDFSRELHELNAVLISLLDDPSSEDYEQVRKVAITAQHALNLFQVVSEFFSRNSLKVASTQKLEAAVHLLPLGVVTYILTRYPAASMIGALPLVFAASEIAFSTLFNTTLVRSRSNDFEKSLQKISIMEKIFFNAVTKLNPENEKVSFKSSLLLNPSVQGPVIAPFSAEVSEKVVSQIEVKNEVEPVTIPVSPPIKDEELPLIASPVVEDQVVVSVDLIAALKTLIEEAQSNGLEASLGMIWHKFNITSSDNKALNEALGKLGQTNSLINPAFEIFQLVEKGLVNMGKAEFSENGNSIIIDETRFSKLAAAYKKALDLYDNIYVKIEEQQTRLQDLMNLAEGQNQRLSGALSGYWMFFEMDSKEALRLKELLSKKLADEENPELISKEILNLVEKGLVDLNLASWKNAQDPNQGIMFLYPTSELGKSFCRATEGHKELVDLASI